MGYVERSVPTWLTGHGAEPTDPPPWPLPMDRRPVEPPGNWSEHVNRPQTEAELAAIQTRVKRGRPCGDDRWQTRIAAKLGCSAANACLGELNKGESK